jgi:hypothetical protein
MLLQDIYHCVTRVTRELRVGHPDTPDAKRHIHTIFNKLINCEYDNKQQFVNALSMYAEQYRSPSSYSAMGAMEQLFEVANMCVTTDPKYSHHTINKQDLVDIYTQRYCEAEHIKPDDDGRVTAGALRKAGYNSIKEMVKPNNIGFLWNRTNTQALNTTGTTSNEALHRVFKGRLTRFGGIRTHDSALQYVKVIIHQFNYAKLNNCSDQYYIDIEPLPTNFCTMRLHPMLPYNSNELLRKMRYEFEKKRITPWTDNEDRAIKDTIVKLAVMPMTENNHIRNPYMYLSSYSSLAGHRTSQQVKKRIKHIIKSMNNPPVI